MAQRGTEREALTPAEVAAYLKIGLDKVYRALAAGEIPGRRVGKVWRTPRWLLEDWLEQR
jgi:excisionase family DNA binding protein